MDSQALGKPRLELLLCGASPRWCGCLQCQLLEGGWRALLHQSGVELVHEESVQVSEASWRGVRWLRLGGADEKLDAAAALARRKADNVCGDVDGRCFVASVRK